MNTPEAIVQLTDLLKTACADASVSVDAPKNPHGEWWFDVGCEKFTTSVSWSLQRGFGIFTAGGDGFGDRPDEIYAKPVDACARICQLIARSSCAQTGALMHLKELRNITGTSQTELAAALSINQAAISRMENRGDLYLSSLNQYVAAMGGQLELRAKFEDFEARIEPIRQTLQKQRG